MINEPRVDEPQPIALRKSQREKRSAIPNDYVVYLHEFESDLGIENDPMTFSQAMNDVNSNKWFEAMKDELKSMVHNEVRDLVELLKDIERLVANGSLRPNATPMVI